ncbi:MAG: macro domain-containing protein [Nitrososphaerota archaeon]
MTEYSISGLKIVVMRGDITEIDADAIVVPANSRLIMGGGVAGAVKRKGGAEIEKEAMSKGPIPIGEAVSTGGGVLKTRFVIHSPTMERPAGETDPHKVYLATKAAMKEANRLNVKTLAFPGMGTGVGGLNPRLAAQQMVRAILEAMGEGGWSLERVYLVAFDRELEEAFKAALEEAAKNA